jgi:hypothetical protein
VRWLGIDFSGSDDQWRERPSASAVWITRIRQGSTGRFTVEKLCRVQDLSGGGNPFDRLATLLCDKEFAAAGLDAPFAIPVGFNTYNSHRELLTAVGRTPCEGRNFPKGADLLRLVAPNLPTRGKKEYRDTESYWIAKRVNVRSTL